MSLLTKPGFRGLSVGSGWGFVRGFTFLFSLTLKLIGHYLVAWSVSARPYLLKHTSTCWNSGFHSFLRKLDQRLCETVEKFRLSTFFNTLYLLDVYTLQWTLSGLSAVVSVSFGFWWRSDVRAKNLTVSDLKVWFAMLGDKHVNWLLTVCCFMNGTFLSALVKVSFYEWNRQTFCCVFVFLCLGTTAWKPTSVFSNSS